MGEWYYKVFVICVHVCMHKYVCIKCVYQFLKIADTIRNAIFANLHPLKFVRVQHQVELEEYSEFHIICSQMVSTKCFDRRMFA